jgi:hypothetical protein
MKEMIMTMTDVETMFVLTGKWVRNNLWMAKGQFPNDGTPISVSFDKYYDEIIKRHIKYNDVIGFYHTHPNMLASPSSTDVETMNTWVDVLGKPLFCLIDGVNGLRTYHWYDDNQFEIGRTFKYEDMFVGYLIGDKNA